MTGIAADGYIHRHMHTHMTERMIAFWLMSDRDDQIFHQKLSLEVLLNMH